MRPLSPEHICRWKLNELIGIVDSFEDKLAQIVTEQHITVAEDYKNILLRYAAKSIVSVQEICILCTHGYPDGALGIARSLYEHFIYIAFFISKRNDPNFVSYVKDYFLDSEIQICKLADAQRTHMNEAEKKSITDRRNNARNAASRHISSPYWWTGFTRFENVVEYIRQQPISNGAENLTIRLHALYKLACSVLHSNSFGNQIRLGVDNEFAGIDTRPLTDGHEFSLELTTTTLIFIIGAICTEFNMDHKLYTDPLNDLVVYYRNSVIPVSE